MTGKRTVVVPMLRPRRKGKRRIEMIEVIIDVPADASLGAGDKQETV